MFSKKLYAAVPLLVGAATSVTWISIAAGLTAQSQEPKASSKAILTATQDRRTPKTDAKSVVVRDDALLTRLAWSSDGKVVATVGTTYESVEVRDSEGKNPRKAQAQRSTIKLWDARTGEFRGSLGDEKKTHITAIAFSPDKKMAAIAVSNAVERGSWEVRLVDAKTWELKRKLGGDGLVLALAFSPDGKRLASGGTSHLVDKGSFVKLWDVQNEKLIGGSKERKGTVRGFPRQRGHLRQMGLPRLPNNVRATRAV
jgi:hypothetical protein